MKDIGNARADMLYGSSKAMKYIPPPDATHNRWLEFFRDKYERRKWAETTDSQKNHVKAVQPQLPKQKQTVATADLLGLQQAPAATLQPSRPSNQSSSKDFFAQFDL